MPSFPFCKQCFFYSLLIGSCSISMLRCLSFLLGFLDMLCSAIIVLWGRNVICLDAMIGSWRLLPSHELPLFEQQMIHLDMIPCVLCSLVDNQGHSTLEAYQHKDFASNIWPIHLWGFICCIVYYYVVKCSYGPHFSF